MKFHIITVFPQMIQEALKWGVIGKALEKGLYSVHTTNPRDFTTDVHKTVDDRPFGGGDGMVMLYEPLAKAIESVPLTGNHKKIYLSPAGRLLTEAVVNELADCDEIILLSGRYGGVDQRILNHYGFESLSIGDYVVSGGELPALILMDALLRKKPGVLGNQDSANQDSFAKSSGFESPLFTRPRENSAGCVPEVFLNGDHKKIEEFRKNIGLALTFQSRPELIGQQELSGVKKYLSLCRREELQMMGLKDSFLKKFLENV